MKIIYSWHPDDPEGITGLPYHGPDNRGSHTLFLLSPQPAPILITDDIYTWDIQMPNVALYMLYRLHLHFTSSINW